MSKYSYEKRRSKSEKIGFYTALSVCIVAISMAIWSAYVSVSDYTKQSNSQGYKSSLNSVTAKTDNDVTGVTAQETTEKAETQPSTLEETTEATEAKTEPLTTAPRTEPNSEQPETKSVLKAMLAVDSTLSYPVKNPVVQKEYSETAVKNKTMDDYRAHTGVDFKCGENEEIFAMTDGNIKEIYNDAMFGTVVAVESDNLTILYCGMDKSSLSSDDTVKAGEKLGTVGEIPSESADNKHIHIEVKVDNQYIDPLTVIANNE